MNKQEEIESLQIQLLHGDCLELMKNIPDGSIDLILTDPPYQVTSCKWDVKVPFEPMWEQINKIIKPNGAIILFGNEPFSSALRMSNIKHYKYDWKYKKRIASNFATVKCQPMKHIEDIMVFSKKGKKINYYPIKQPRAESGKKRIQAKYKNNSKKGGDFLGKIKRNVVQQTYNENLKFPENILEFNNRAKGDRGFHPTQKPVALGQYLIKTYTNKGGTVLDFTAGSGSFGVAAIKEGRNFIGIEKEEKYFDIMKERIDKAKKEEMSKLF